MKTSKAYHYQGKFKYLEGDKWPVMPKRSDCGISVYERLRYYRLDDIYQEALTSALKEAIDFEDQDRIEEIVREELGPDLWNRPLQEGLYNIPEIQVKYAIDCKKECSGLCGECNHGQKVARIKENSKSEEETEIAKLQKFKDYVHDRLDKMGVPVDPESPHKAAGCRIGGRLDWIESILSNNYP